MGGGPAESPPRRNVDSDNDNNGLSPQLTPTDNALPVSYLPQLVSPVLTPLGSPQDKTKVRLLYCKSKVYVHPSQDIKEQIPGYISIVERLASDYLLAWTPESMVASSDRGSFVYVEANPEYFDDDDQATAFINTPHSSISTTPDSQSTFFSSDSTSPHAQYAFSIPIVKIYSLAVHPPTLAKWYGCVVVNMQGGTSLPPLWFHDDESLSTMLQRQTNQVGASERVRWGGDELIERLARLVIVVRSELEPNMFLVNPTNDDVVTHCASLVASDRPFPSYVVQTLPTNASQTRADLESLSPTLSGAIQMDPLTAVIKEARWNILERFSRITTFSKNTAAHLLESPIARTLLPPSVQGLAQSEHARAMMEEYDSARVYLAKWAAKAAEDSEHEADFLAETGMRMPPRLQHVERMTSGGQGWEEETSVGVFEVLSSEQHTRTEPLTAEQWVTFFDADTGKLILSEEKVREIVFRGGMEHDIRIEAWKFFLGIYPWDSTAAERQQVRKEKVDEYFLLKRQWWDSPKTQAATEFQEQKHRIDKDVHRTDRAISFFAGENMPNPDPDAHQGTNPNLELLKDILITYNFYNTELGYVQGMSDLLAPLFAVMGDEAMAFWGFAGFMERMKSNFYRDQSGMHHQLQILDQLLQFMDPPLYKHLERAEALNLFFCFRWLLIWFKREFKWEQVMSLWEVLWSDHLTNQLHLFVAFAILDKHRYVIMDHLEHFDEILKYVNDLAMTINLNDILQRSEILFYQFRNRLNAADEKRAILEAELRGLDDQSQSQRTYEEVLDELKRLPVLKEPLRELIGMNMGNGEEVQTEDGGLRRRL